MKKGLAVLLALVLTLSLAGCGKKNDTGAPGDDDAIPETPIKLETLHVEFVKGERDVDDLLALKDTLPLVAALSERNVEVGSENRADAGPAPLLSARSGEATAQALADGSVDVAFLPLTACFDHEDTITLALVQDVDDGTAIEDREAIAVTKKNKTVATDGFLAALRGAVEDMCASDEGSAALSLYQYGEKHGYTAADLSDPREERAAYEEARLTAAD